jgi:hypothetical protein
VAGELVGGEVGAVELGADSGEEGVDGDEERFGREAGPFGIPHPLVAHGADGAADEGGVGDAAERGGDHVAVLEGCNKVGALVGIMAQPVKQFGEAPLVGVDAAAPPDAFEAELVSFAGDEFGFFVGAMVAPEVVVVEGLEIGADGDDAGASGVEGHGGDGLAVDAGGGEDVAGGAGECCHLVGMGLGGEVGVFAAAMERVGGGCGADGAARAIDKSDAHAESAEINAGDDGHGPQTSEKTLSFRHPE